MMGGLLGLIIKACLKILWPSFTLSRVRTVTDMSIGMSSRTIPEWLGYEVLMEMTYRIMVMADSTMKSSPRGT